MLNQQVKVVGVNGQLSLGKEQAGKMVLINQLDKETWMIKTGRFIPDSEKWLYMQDNESKLDKALEWAKNNPPRDSTEIIDQMITEQEDV